MNFQLINVTKFILLLLLSCSLVGCGGGGKPIAPVTGTVTLDGEPAADIELIFTPKQVDGGSAVVGPFSMGLTDAQGKYTLTTRNGEPGAVVGEHSVTFNYAGEDPEEAIAEAKMAMQEAKAGKNDSLVTEMKAKIDRLKNAKVMPNKYSGSGSIISGTVNSGENTLDFSLSTKDGADDAESESE